MAQSQRNIVTTVTQLIAPAVEELGCSLWDVEFVKEGARFYLRITIDKEDGVGIEDCEAVHRAIDPLLDEADPIEPSYYLEVSSPGVERNLRKIEHFTQVVGQEILCKLYRPQDGAKSLRGVLQSVDAVAQTITVQLTDLTQKTLPLQEIAKANTVFEF